MITAIDCNELGMESSGDGLFWSVKIDTGERDSIYVCVDIPYDSQVQISQNDRLIKPWHITTSDQLRSLIDGIKGKIA